MGKKFFKVFRWVNGILIVITLLSYLAPYVDPNAFWPVSILGVLFPVLALLNVFFILFWLVSKPAMALMSFFTLAIGWSQIMNLYALPFNQYQSMENEPSQIGILSYNLAHLNKLQFSTAEQTKRAQASFTEYLKGVEWDVLCTQEVSAKNISTLKNAIDTNLYTMHKSYLGILSQYPIVKQGYLYDEHEVVYAVWADLDIHNQTIRVYCLYLPSNLITQDANELAGDAGLQEEKTWVTIKNILLKYKDASRRRATLLEPLLAHIKSCTTPFVVCGDFNDVPHSYVYHQISNDLDDSFRQAKGMAVTYGGHIPLLRIDYILANPGFKIVSYQRDKVFYSDHFPIFSTLALSK